MANIQQAAAWIESGLKVTRPGKWNSLTKGKGGRLVFASDGSPACLSTNDIRADDWIITGEPLPDPPQEQP